MILQMIVFLAAGYLLGCIPFGLLIGFAKGIDVRKVGSKNIGATNLLRVAGKGPGLIALALDMGKGALAASLVNIFEALGGQPSIENTYLMLIGGMGAIVGHAVNAFLRFKGGKAVAVSCGVFTVLAPLHLVSALLLFVAVVAATRYVSLGSILASVEFSVVLFVWPADERYLVSYLALFAMLFIVIKHRTNISRMLKGQENKFGDKPKHGLN